MNTKLTLRLEEQLIQRAKTLAKARGKSLSQLVADYFTTLEQEQKARPLEDLPPGVSSLLGVARNADASLEAHRDHLVAKYLEKPEAS